MAVVTGAIFGLKEVARVLSLGVLYVFAVLPVAVFFGLAYALAVSVASMLAFNFFFLPDVEEAPFRDLGDPLLRYLRRITAQPETVAVVVMPELVFTGSARLLHNQRALYIKRLLLFEPNVILVSVPYRLD